MKKNQVNKLLIQQTKRRNVVLSLAIITILIVMLSATLFFVYKQRNENQYVKFNESSNVSYMVHLNQNDFFEDEYLTENKQYIASLIKNISAHFTYNLKLEKATEYKYKYRIDATVDVKDSDTQNSLYTNTQNLVKEKSKKSKYQNLEINEGVNIDYNYYNDLIKKFVSAYDVESAISTLTINMHINVAGSCEEDAETKDSVVSLVIPLTTKTVAIDLSNNLVNTTNNVLECETGYKNNQVILILAVILIIAAILIVAFIIRYTLLTRTAESIYEKELKKILNNYGTYIQMLGNDFYFRNYHMLKVDSFTDMLEIRDTIRQPILMKENPEKNGAYFIIPSNTQLLYIYRLKVSDIEKEINQKEDPLDKFFK